MKVIKAPDPRLLLVAEPFDFAKPQQDPILLARTLAGAMVSANAAGLAAPQIGISLRVFALMRGGHPTVCFNPEILTRQGSMAGPEGCLSFPGLFPMVRRASGVVVRCWTSTGLEQPNVVLTGLEARCFQHELDHLDGVLLDQRASAQAMVMARARRAHA